MSIIYDALKKTQHKLRNATLLSPDQRAIANGQEKNKFWLWAAIFTICLGFIICGFILTTLVFSKNSAYSTPSPVGNSPAANQISQTSFKPGTAFVKEPAASSEIVLNGIMSMGDEQLALINNKIYKAGDYIGDKRVLSISAEKVEIFDKGNVITLTTK